MSNLYIQRLTNLAVIPTRETADSAGMDVRACLWSETVTIYPPAGAKLERKPIEGIIGIYPGERALIPTSLKMSVDADHCIKFYPRSGLSLKNGMTLINCVGVGDRDYPGEYFITLVNHSHKVFMLEHGERCCQLMVERVEPVAVVEVEQLPGVESQRKGGFGSTRRK